MQEELEIDSGKEIFIEEAIFITEDKEMQDLGEGALKKDINIILKDQEVPYLHQEEIKNYQINIEKCLEDL